MSQENVEIVREAIATFARERDGDLSLYAPDFVLVNAPDSPWPCIPTQRRPGARAPQTN